MPLNNTPSPPAKAPDPYVEYLSDISETHDVVAGEDIIGDNGLLLAKKGTLIKKSVADRLLLGRPSRSLDEVLHIGKCMSRQSLMADYDRLFARWKDCELVHLRNGFAAQLNQLVFRREIPYLLMARLTVMRECLRMVYVKCLFVSWISAQIADELKLSSESVYSAFFAGLFHKVGLLHIPQALAQDKFEPTPKNMAMYLEHVQLGANVIKKTGHYSAEVFEAIMHHHDGHDISGAPILNTSTVNPVLAQIIALGEIVYEMRQGQDGAENASLSNIMPYLRVNAATQSAPSYAGLLRLLHRCNLKRPYRSAGDKDLNKMRLKLQDNTSSIQQVLTELVSLSDCYTPTINSNDGKVIQALITRLICTMNSTGIASDEISQWLLSMRSEELAKSAGELLEMQDTMYESVWLIKRAIRAIRRELQADNPDIRQSVERVDALLTELEKSVESSWH